MARGVPVAAVGLVVVFLAAAAHGAAAKGCTNTLPGLTASHTERAAAQLREVLDHGHDHDHKQHLTPTDESTWMALMPRRFLGSTAPPREAFDWLMLYRKLRGGTPVDGGAAGAFLSEASLHDVRLEPGTVYWQAQQTNLEYLLLLDVDRLIWSFRMQAGLTAPGTPYGGWEGPPSSSEDTSSFFAGHYMSATAKMWASTHNDTLHAKMSSVVDALYDCQKKMGTGYLSAFPSEFFDRVEATKAVWAPYYTIHKVMQGLLDQYAVAGSSKALEMVVGMANYFSDRLKSVIQKYSIERH